MSKPITWTAFAGLNNAVDAQRLNSVPSKNNPAIDLVEATNVDIDESGAITRRDGFTRLVSTSTHSLWPNQPVPGIDFALCVQAQTLKRITAAAVATTLKALASNEPVSYATVNDCVYYNNGTDTGVIQNGAQRSWGLPVAPLPTVTAGSGQLPAGEYQFAMVYVRADGQEGGCGVAGRVTVAANASLTFTLPSSSDTNVAAKSLFLSTTNGDVLYRVVQTAASTFTYSGDTTDLPDAPLLTQFLVPAPAGQIVAYHHGRLIVAQDDILYPSEEHAYELFNPQRYIPVDGRATLIASMEGEGMFVGTDRMMGWVQGTDDPALGQWVARADYGAIPGTLALVDASLFLTGEQGARVLPLWLSQKGLCVGLPGGQIRNLTRQRYQFTATGRGCSLFRPDTNQFVAVTTT